MQKLLFPAFLLVFFVFSSNNTPAQSSSSIINRLQDVKTVYLDEDSFKFVFSSCSKTYGNLKVVCTEHWEQRKEFLSALSNWLGKYNFLLIGDKQKADAILQGDLSIDDLGYRNYKSAGINKTYEKGTKNRKNDDREVDEKKPRWEARGWLVNQNGEKLWESDGMNFPKPSFGWSKPSKIEAKKLARELQYDFEKSR